MMAAKSSCCKTRSNIDYKHVASRQLPGSLSIIIGARLAAGADADAALLAGPEVHEHCLEAPLPAGLPSRGPPSPQQHVVRLHVPMSRYRTPLVILRFEPISFGDCRFDRAKIRKC